jgi:predicted ArsR family transcriptional regulator
MNVTLMDVGPAAQRWTFLTNHAHVLLALATDPELRVRDVAIRVGITERAAQRLLHDLVAEGYVLRQKQGRRNTYRLLLDRPLRHPIEAQHTVGDLVSALCSARSSSPR